MSSLPQQVKVGFIGTGVMGKRMILRLLQAGHTVYVYNRTKANAMPLAAEGAIWKDTVAQVAEIADIVVSMVGYPTDVEEVYFGQDGALENVRKGCYLVDMTTSSPSLAERIGTTAESLGVHALDAPVSGGDIGARDGTLSIMVGGREEDFRAVLPVLQVLGKNIVLQGPWGAGQHTKMANQIAIASNMMGVCEAVSYALRAGLDANRVLQSISSGAAGSWSLSNLAPRMIQGDMAPGFYVKHFIKDMNIALTEAESLGLDTPGLHTARELYQRLADEGYDSMGTQALFKYYGETGGNE